MAKQTHHYYLKALEEIYDLADLLARHFPEPAHVMTGIYELLLNALEHGNLGLGSETKNRLVREGGWEIEIMRRLTLPEHAHKQVVVTVTCDDGICQLTIADQGNGFPWEKYLRLGANPLYPNGRGLLIAFSSGFDQITFNRAGNAVTCIKRVAATAEARAEEQFSVRL